MAVDKTPVKIAGEDKMLSILWYWKDKSFGVLQAPICSPKMQTDVPFTNSSTTAIRKHNWSKNFY